MKHCQIGVSTHVCSPMVVGGSLQWLPARVMSGLPRWHNQVPPAQRCGRCQKPKLPLPQTRALPLSSTTCSAKMSPSTILRHRPLVTRSLAVSYRLRFPLLFPGCPSFPARRDLRQHVGPTLRTAVRALLRDTVAAAAHRTAAAALLWTKSSGVRGRRSSLARGLCSGGAG